MTTLTARGVTLAYDQRVVIRDLDFTVPTGQVTVIVGPNACGKSTLLRALARLLRPADGAVLLDGRPLHQIPTREVARKISVLPQQSAAPDGILVADLVARGRQPHQSWWRQWSPADEQAVTEAMARTGVAELAGRYLDELSGGQRQRVWIAMTLAQRTEILLLDEPTTFLDIAHQMDVLDLVTALNREQGCTIVAVLHDLNQACRYADHIVFMRGGRIVAQGPPATVVTADLVGRVFSLSCLVTPCPATGAPMVVPTKKENSCSEPVGSSQASAPYSR